MSPANTDRLCNMDDIAQACGVSKMTVSRVLRNEEYGVSERARTKVLECAKRLNYRPNLLAKRFATKRSGYIGLALPFEGLLSSNYFSRLVAGIQAGLTGSDCQLALFDTLSPDLNSGDKLAQLYYERRVDGLIAIAPHSEESFIDKLSSEKIPVIIAGEPTANRQVVSVSADDERCVQGLIEHLVQNGHREIGFLSGPADLLSAQSRLQAFVESMRDHGLSVRQDFILNGEYGRSVARDRASAFLRNDKRPTAWVCANDLMALGVLDAASIVGMRVPSDFSVVGIDDLDDAKTSFPPLTSMHQPIRKIGEAAAKVLLEWIRSEKKPTQLPDFAPWLVQRESVKNLSSHH